MEDLPPKKKAADSGRRSQEAPGREAAEPFAGRGSAVPEHTPGATGRPARKRTPEQEEVTPDETASEEAAPGQQRGGTRAVRLTDPKRKKRTA